MRDRPGAGTSILARRLATLVPEMTLAETLETTRIHRVAGWTGRPTAVVTARPCRAPHHLCVPKTCCNHKPAGERLCPHAARRS
jgi:predicted ATPase with chaperone activity